MSENNSLAQGIVKLKIEFKKKYHGTSHIHEVIPTSYSDSIQIEENSLSLLHRFVKNNPIYYNSYESDFLGISGIVYEGDINEYWIDSIKHDTSYAPFYPTWILSAYAAILSSKKLGIDQLVDIGSGDGRIAYCGAISGIKSFGIEIDQNLVNLQEKISFSTGVHFNPIRADATLFDYSSLSLSKPVFFIGGLPEMGEMLVEGVIEKVFSLKLKEKIVFVLTGSHLKRKFSKDDTEWGWGTVIKKFDLDVIDTLTLPTQWTMDQTIDTPYIFTKFNG